MDVVISVGDWEHECCGPAVERNEVRGFSCARTTAEDGLEQLVEVRHGPFEDEQAHVEVHGRVKDLRVERDDGSQQPVLRIPSGRALRGFDADDDGHLEDPWTGAPLPGGRRFVVVLDVAAGVGGSADR